MAKTTTLLCVALLVMGCRLAIGCPEGCICLGNDAALPCSACRKGFYLQSGTCVSNCAPGFVRNGTVCDRCPTRCLKCNAEGTCLQCQRPSFLTKAGRCVIFRMPGQRDTIISPTKPTNEIIETFFAVDKTGPSDVSIRHVLTKINRNSRINFKTAPKYGTLSIVNDNREKFLHQGDFIDLETLKDSGLFYTSRTIPSSRKDFATFVVHYQNHDTLIRMNFSVNVNEQAGQYVSDSSRSLHITEGESVGIPENYFRLEAFGVLEADLFLRLKRDLNYGSLMADGKNITVGRLFNHQTVSQGKLIYQCDRETGFSPVQEMIEIDILQKKIAKGSNGRINFNPIAKRSIMDDYQLISSQSITVDISPRDNQSPLVTINGELDVSEGESEIVSPEIITIVDLDTNPDVLTVVIETAPKFGYLEVRPHSAAIGKRLGPKGTFPLEALLQEQLSYVQSQHEGYEHTEDSFTFHVTDGSNKSPTVKLEINILDINDEPPHFTMTPLKVSTGTNHTIITTDDFLVKDLDTISSEITVAVSQLPLYGSLKRYESEWSFTELSVGDTFTYDNLEAGDIAYEPLNFDNAQDEISFTISDGDNEVPQEAVLRIEIDNNLPSTTTTTTTTAPTTTTTTTTTTVTIHEPCIVEFTETHLNVKENEGLVKIPLKRSGDLSSTCSVLCITEPRIATEETDFNPRTKTEQSRLFFLRGVTSISCDVQIVDDNIYEDTEDFIVRLIVPESEKSSVSIGNRSETSINIDDEDDRTVIEFEKKNYKIPESSKSILVELHRYGDLRRLSKVKIFTKDGSAKAGIDYKAKSIFVDFGPGENVAVLQIDLEEFSAKKYWPVNFQLILSKDDIDIVNAKIGSLPITTITIVPEDRNRLPVLPAEPYVVSLLHYDSVAEGLVQEIDPGYPVVCVTPCDPRYPRYADTQSHCRNSGLDMSKITFSWEFSFTADDSFGSIFHQLSESTLFGSVDDVVLDSSFFSSGSRIRCVSQPLINGTKGLAIRSKPVTISTNHKLCPPPSLSPIGQQPFRAGLNYVRANQNFSQDFLRIQVDIPHFDGMIPLVSTYPLHGVRYLLTEALYRSHHECSNLKPGFAFLEPDNAASGSGYPYEYSESIRKEASVRLYRNLDLQSCMWKFQARFSMADLMDLCGGQVRTEPRFANRHKTHLTVRVPLYVAFVTSSGGWTSIEHRTELEFSFLYEPILVHRGLRTENPLTAKPRVTRITTDPDGRLVIEFRTETQSASRFLLRDPELGLDSVLTSPSHVGTLFHLELLWTKEQTAGSDQLWRATSNFTLDDYSGNYTLTLIPCLYSTDRNKCRIEKSINVSIPVNYQQPFKPLPVTYSLDTLFHLTNSAEDFLKIPKNSTDLKELNSEEIFSRGQKVYGRVLWLPEQDLSPTYRIEIEKLYLCSGRDGYVPAFDPTGEDHNGIPHYGCMDSFSRLKYRILLLDREEPHFVDSSVNGLTMEAKFANNIDELQGLAKIILTDGFVFSVDPLYKLESGIQWFLQVIYTVKPVAGSRRYRRSSGSSSSQLRNGTRIRALTLTWDSAAQEKLTASKDSTICFTLLAVLVTSIGVSCAAVYYRRLRQQRSRSSESLPATASLPMNDKQDDNPTTPDEKSTLV